MKQLDANPELKEEYRKLVKNLPADQQEKAMTSIAARTLRTITPSLVSSSPADRDLASPFSPIEAQDVDSQTGASETQNPDNG